MIFVHTQLYLLQDSYKLADLSTDEFLDIAGNKFENNEDVDKIIMKAREDWFKE